MASGSASDLRPVRLLSRPREGNRLVPRRRELKPVRFPNRSLNTLGNRRVLPKVTIWLASFAALPHICVPADCDARRTARSARGKLICRILPRWTSRASPFEKIPTHRQPARRAGAGWTSRWTSAPAIRRSLPRKPADDLAQARSQPRHHDA